MTKRIFFANFLTAIITSSLCSLVLTMVTYRSFLENEAEKIESQTQLATQGVEKLGLDFFTDLVTFHYRITWVDSNGDVLFDTHKMSEIMENHGDRIEILDAMEHGFGSSTRKSDTLLTELVYCAQRLEDDTVLRVSGDRKSLLAFFISILQPFCLIFLLGGWLSALLAYGLTKSIMTPLTNLDLDHPLQNVKVYDEIAPLLQQIQRQYRKINLQIKEMSQKQEEFETITRDMNEGLLLLNQHGQIISINDCASQLFKTNKSQSVGRNIITLHRSLEMQQLLDKAFQGERAEGIIPMGQQMYQMNASPIIQGNLISGVAVLLLDATERNESEEMRREFTANVSHELKTPLHSISGCAELLSHNLVENKDIPQFTTQIYNEAQRLIRLVDEIISLSRLDEGAVALSKEEVDLFSIAKEAEFQFRDTAKTMGISLQVVGDSGKMSGSYTLLSGLLRNLCENAIKYNKPNGTVEISVQEYPTFIRLQVNDSGIGISAKDKQLIFQRFYRVDKSRSKEIGGTGLGLSIVKRTVALHQGTLSLESSLNVGTSIQIDFPKQDSERNE